MPIWTLSIVAIVVRSADAGWHSRQLENGGVHFRHRLEASAPAPRERLSPWVVAGAECAPCILRQRIATTYLQRLGQLQAPEKLESFVGPLHS
jgi:hypothetical protein